MSLIVDYISLLSFPMYFQYHLFFPFQFQFQSTCFYNFNKHRVSSHFCCFFRNQRNSVMKTSSNFLLIWEDQTRCWESWNAYKVILQKKERIMCVSCLFLTKHDPHPQRLLIQQCVRCCLKLCDQRSINLTKNRGLKWGFTVTVKVDFHLSVYQQERERSGKSKQYISTWKFTFKPTPFVYTGIKETVVLNNSSYNYLFDIKLFYHDVFTLPPLLLLFLCY